MDRISHVTIRGYKSLKDVSLDLRTLNVLIGANGSGKSNFLAFFRMLNSFTDGQLQTYVGLEGGASAVLHYGVKVTAAMDCRLVFETPAGANEYTFRLAGAAPDRLIFLDEAVSFRPVGRPGGAPVSLGSGHTESRLPEAIDGGNPTARVVKWHLDRWRVYHFHDTSNSAAVKQACEVADNRFLKGDGANLAAFLYLLRNAYPDSLRDIRDSVRLVAPFFDDFVLEPSALNQEKILLRWREAGTAAEFGAHQMSDGLLRFVSLATVLLQPAANPSAPGVPRIYPPLAAIIDEPELGLHPHAIVQLASLLRSASRRMQVIVTTQSLGLLDRLVPDVESVSDVVVVERRETASELHPLDPQELGRWLEEYSASDLWEKGVLGGSPFT